MLDFIRSAKKALGGGFAALGATIGITWSELDWRELVVAFFIGLVGVYFAPKNVEVPSGNLDQ